MRNKLRRALEAWVVPGDHVTCALSGGADSVAMTHCIAALGPELGITVSACHFNHRLRGDASDGDEAFCRELCRSLDISLAVSGADVAACSRETGESIEEAARRCRYDFFNSLPGFIATAHTADDQAETFLLNLLRGTGLKGLGGIPPRRQQYLRPMLCVSRQEILEYLAAQSLSHREDATNEWDDCVRNRLRHHVIPLLKQENPSLLATLEHTTGLLRQDEALLQAQADALLENGWLVEPLRTAPAPLRRRALRRILTELQVPKLSAAHIEAAEALVLHGDPSARFPLPGGRVLQREYDRLTAPEEAQTPAFRPVTLPCPGEAVIPELGLRFCCEGPAGEPIVIRPRKTGDTIRLPGGTKTVKKLLIDRKIPARQRESIPILERGGTVICVWGVADAAGERQDLIITIQKEENR